MKKKTHFFKNVFWVAREIFNYDKKYIYILLISVVISGILPPISTLLSQEVVNALQKKMHIKIIFFYVILYISVDLVDTLYKYGLQYYKTRFSYGFNLHFNIKILEKASKLKLKDYEDSETYNMISRAQDEGNGKQLVYIETFMNIFSGIITMISYLLIIISFKPQLVIIIIIVPIIKYLITKKIGILSFDLLKRRTNDLRKSRYFQYLMTYGEYFKELKIFNLFSVFIEKYKFYTKKFNDENLCLERKKVVSLSIVSIIETLVDGGLFSYIVYNGYIGTILIGNVLTYMKAITQVKQQMTVVLGTFSEIYKESFFIDQIIDYFQLLETNEERKIVINSIENIKIEDLSYKYKEGQDYILKNINLEIKRNETVAFVGQNGSGKTTLIKLIMGFYDDYEGNIYINGIELKKIDQKSLIDKIATVFQDYVKYQATFRENISYGNMSVFEDDSVLYSICEELGIKRLIENSENKLDSQIGHWFDNGMQISIGQWQKVALARAFIKNAELYILDEPNSALDSIAEADMLKLYEKIIRNHMGIIVTHKFNVLVKRVDRIVVLSEGVISGIGTHESLLKLNSDYRKMYEAQDITQ
ncbi:ABC transporter ATP-binding protein [Dorea sp.]|uniref:ABC transporter ATP-binding protein n=2 Tax=Dorea TaxID=189330 RepID=UPI003528556E